MARTEKRRLGLFLSLICVLILAAGTCGTLAQGVNDAPVTAYVRETQYEDYLSQFADQPRPDQTIVIEADSYARSEGTTSLVEGFQGMPGYTLLTGEIGWVEWDFHVEEAGLYNMQVDYYPIEGRSSSIERSLAVNGKRPYAEAGFLRLDRVWGDEGPLRIDNLGNHVRSRQVEYPEWRTTTFTDPVGYELEPFLFHFEAGLNTIRWTSVTEPMAVRAFRLYQEPPVRSYTETAEEYAALGYEPTSGIQITIQGQDAQRRSAPTLFPQFDQGDPTVEPYHPAQIRLNSIGGHSWRNVDEWIRWEFTVPEDGLYQVAIKAKQDQRRGFWSSRQVRINGEIPFEEAKAIRFPFSQYYQMNVLSSDEGETALVYLEADRVHTIELKVTLGDAAELLRRTEDTLYELNTIYRRIIMITSGSPDPLRSYQLHVRIPGLIERLRIQGEILREMADDMEAYTGQAGGHTQVLQATARMLERMADRHYMIPRLLGEYRDNIGAMGTWIMHAREQPLLIDRILIASPDVELPRAEPTFWQTLQHEIRAFLASFTHDYNRIGDMTDPADVDPDENMLKVWIGSGRDQAQALKQMIEDTFTPETGIAVDFELIENLGRLMIPAIIAGEGPDVALGAAQMDLAFRGAVHNLAKFDDFDEVAQRFFPSAFVPFRFRDQVFGLPEVQGFQMLFYRKDVLNELGLTIPQTWDDVYWIIPELQKHNMEFGIPANMDTFLMFLYQQGVSLYKEDVVATNLGSEASVATFRQLTELFTLFNLLIEFNAQNRFRLGEMPLVISNYGLFNTLSVFAPELRGEWSFTTIPGTVMSDGSINRTVSVTGTVVPPGQVAVPPGTSGAIILESSEMKDEAWEFLKWWTRTDTQVRFGREMESLMGAAARYATANVEAMQQLPWRAAEREVLLEQWAWVEGVPPLLGEYYVRRQFDWLFRAVVLQHEPIREAIQDYSRAANEEITRKRAEFGLETTYAEISQELKDQFWSHYTHIYRLDTE